jgi:succinate-semialdehyde dehydrogenase/glutarate-semialdehyde dehydrogenase
VFKALPSGTRQQEMSTLDVRAQSRVPKLAVVDPATGEPIGYVPACAAPEAHDAVHAARTAQRAWARTAPEARGSLLKAAARRLREHARELAELQTREAGTPLAGSLGGVEAGIGAIEAYSELGPLDHGRAPRGDLVLCEPRGVIAILMPWSDPLAATCGALGAALVAGNAVVLKPSEKAPLAAERVVELLDLGPVLQLLHGDERAARPLATHPGVDLVIRPGEEAAGSHLAIVDAGVDPEAAALQVAASAFAGAGQSCGSLERVHVHHAIADSFLDALADRARAVKVGPGLDPATDVGPLIDEDHRLWVHRQVTDAVYSGAALLAGGEPLYGPGYFYPPTVLAGAPDDALVVCGETRGPVVAVRAADSFEAALECGARLGVASVLTPSQAHAQRAWRRLPARTVSVNAIFRAPRATAEPELLDAVTRTKVVHLS